MLDVVFVECGWVVSMDVYVMVVWFDILIGAALDDLDVTIIDSLGDDWFAVYCEGVGSVIEVCALFICYDVVGFVLIREVG